MANRFDLSVIIPANHEGDNLSLLLPWVNQVLEGLGLAYELVVITTETDKATATACVEANALLIEQSSEGYGGALLEAFDIAKGEFYLTMDADLSHRPHFISTMWHRRRDAEIVIASRYIDGGSAEMPTYRAVLSRVVNTAFRRGIAVPVHDLSSGFRLYHSSVINTDQYVGTDFDILEEIIIRAYCDGWRVLEVPFAYAPRENGSSSARILHVGQAYMREFLPLWRLRNSIEAADYDARAYDSIIPLQRYWQRTRYQIVRDLITDRGPVLDVGCGSSRIISALPEGSIALDILMRKLRYARKFNIPLLQASGFSLPFADATFPCVLCSEVIEHVPKDSPILDELCRVLKPGGRLVIGTPDYARREWVYLEKLYAKVAPGGYADEHIAHYTKQELMDHFVQLGFVHEATRYILRGELIMAFRK